MSHRLYFCAPPSGPSMRRIGVGSVSALGHRLAPELTRCLLRATLSRPTAAGDTASPCGLGEPDRRLSTHACKVHATDDPVVPVQTSRRYSARCADAAFNAVAGAGHVRLLTHGDTRRVRLKSLERLAGPGGPIERRGGEKSPTDRRMVPVSPSR